MERDEENYLEKGEIFGELEPKEGLNEPYLDPDGAGSNPEDESAIPAPVIFTAADMATKLNVPGWRQAALLRYMDWLPDRVVTEEEYKEALAALDGRRLGGGRR